MNLQRGKLLRIHVNERDRYEGKPLYEALVQRCKELNVAGATVFRALEGFGETVQFRRSHIFGSDEPIVISIVERPDKAQEILPILQGMMTSGLIAVTDGDVAFVTNSRPALIQS